MTTSLVECLLNTHEYYECLENTQGDCDVDSDVGGGAGLRRAERLGIPTRMSLSNRCKSFMFDFVSLK